jgi:hypothetical protein
MSRPSGQRYGIVGIDRGKTTGVYMSIQKHKRAMKRARELRMTYSAYMNQLLSNDFALNRIADDSRSDEL